MISAPVAELEYARGLGPRLARGRGSSPLRSTKDILVGGQGSWREKSRGGANPSTRTKKRKPVAGFLFLVP